MAFPLCLITSNFITRCAVRSYTTMTKRDFFDQSWVKNLCPKISSMSLNMNIYKDHSTINLSIGDDVYVKMPGEVILDAKLKTLLIQGKTDKECFLSGIKLGDKTTSNEEMKNGMLKVTLPNEDEFKTDTMVNIIANSISSFLDINVNRGWAYYDMFYDRSILGEGLCPVIAMLPSINSFSIHKSESKRMLSIKISMPRSLKMKFTKQGLRVSLYMDRAYSKKDNPVTVDVKTYFDYDTFFIEARTKKEHHIIGIRLPEGIQKKHNLIKREMKDGYLYVLLPWVEKEEIKINI